MTIKPLYPTVRPSLDLNFAATKRLDPRVTFSRSSSGTYTDADGLIKSAATNVPRFDHAPTTGESLGLLVEEARTNVVTYNVIDDINWTKTDGATIAPNAALAPDGTFTAALVTFPGSNTPRINRSLTIGAGTVTQTAWIRAVTGTITIRVGNPSDFGSNQTVGTSWTRVQATYNSGSNSFGIYCSNPVSAAQFYVWGAQMELGSFPTSYIPTPATFTSRSSTATYYDANGVIQTAASGVARSNAFFPDSNGVMRPAGLLLEAAGTNLVTYSEQVDNGAWGKFEVTVTPNATTAPDGTTTADSVLETTNATQHRFDTSTTSVTSGTTYTFSIFLKPNGRDAVILQTKQIGTGGEALATYTLTGNGSVSSQAAGGIGTISKLPGGWYRCTLTATCSANSTGYGRVFLETNATVGGVGVFAWGAQIETGSYATSYIPTTTATVTRSADVSTSATVTRSADVAQITGANFSSWYRQDEGTIFTSSISARVNAVVVSLYRTSPTEEISNYGLTNATYFGVYTSGAYQANISPGSIAARQAYKQAGAYKVNDFAASRGGATVVKDTNGSVPVSINSMNVGVDFTGSHSSWGLNGTISRFTYWPTRLPDATLQALTV